MRNLLLLISKYGALIVFILLESISLFLIVRFNNDQRQIFLYSSNLFAGEVNQRYDATIKYFNLRSSNDSILMENARLLEQFHNKVGSLNGTTVLSDSSFSQYGFLPAMITSKTLHLRNNRMTLNKGQNDGINEGMGVISESGIVGIVRGSNSHFSSVIPLINTQLQISAKVKSKNYVGDLTWKPYDERYMILNHIPKHALVSKGDTIETSGYSTVFPPGIEIGIIKEISLPGGSNYFEILVKLNNSLANLEHVYVVENRLYELHQQMINEE